MEERVVGRLPISVESEDGRVVREPTAADLYRLLERIGGDGDTYLVVGRLPGRDHYYVQTRRHEEEPYSVEYRDGSADRHFQVEMAAGTQVLEFFVAWASDRQDWQGGHAWRRLRL